MDEPDTPSVADRLASELEDDGELVDVGGFDIDAGRALDKLARFQLADPRTYVLRLAEAGLIAGASQLHFDFRGSEVRVVFHREDDPIIVSQASLERLTSVLVSRAPLPAGSPPRAMLVQLATAALAILRLAPRYFAIESVGLDGRGHRRVYAPEPSSESLMGAEPGTRIEIVEGFRLGAWLCGLAGTRREQQLLQEHCGYTEVPIFVGRRVIGRKRAMEKTLVAESVLDAGGVVVGEAGFVADGRVPAQVLVLSRGLLIEAVTLPCTPGFRAVIDVPLPRDLSQSAVARGPELDAALAPVLAIHARLAPQIERVSLTTT